MTTAMNRSIIIAAAVALASFAGCGGGGGSTFSAPGQAMPSAPPAGPSPTPSSQPTVPPGTVYANLYNAIAPQVASFTSSVNQNCPSSGTSTMVFAEDDQANSNSIFFNLPNDTQAEVNASITNAVNYAKNLQQLMGAKGVTIDISYPMLVNNPANLPNSNFTTSNYSAYLNYYEQVVSGIHALGMQVNVETNIIFPSLITPPQTPQQYYSGLTETMLESGVAEVAQHVIDSVKPDYVDLATEPSTIDFNTGLSGIDTPSGFATFVAGIQSRVSNAGSPVKLGAGSDNWESYQFFSSLETNGQPFQHFDIHIYPPDYLQNGITYLANLKTSGEPTLITENWLNKEAKSVDGMSTIPAQTVSLRDGYSFWGSLDAQYVTSILRLANCNNAAFISFNHVDVLFSYVDYNATTANYSYNQMQQALANARNAAVANNTVSPSGNAIRAYDGLAPLAMARHPR